MDLLPHKEYKMDTAKKQVFGIPLTVDLVPHQDCKMDTSKKKKQKPKSYSKDPCDCREA